MCVNIVTESVTKSMGRKRVYNTNADRQYAYRLRHARPKRRKRRRLPAYFSRASDLWETQPERFNPLHVEFGFTLDACAIADNAKCVHYFSPEENGLAQDWSTEIVWMNPPYSQIAVWVRKAYEASKSGATVVCYITSRTDTAWFHDYILPYAEIRFLRGRERFVGAESSAPFPSLVAIFRPPIVH
jgi:phage N-6-adenine-methyltransferase